MYRIVLAAVTLFFFLQVSSVPYGKQTERPRQTAPASQAGIQSPAQEEREEQELDPGLVARPAREEDPTFVKSWGRVSFHQGFPQSIVLKYGSQTDLLPAPASLPDSKGSLGAIEYRKGNTLYSTRYDSDLEQEVGVDSVQIKGWLRDREGRKSPAGATYVLTWTVSNDGFIKLEVLLNLNEPCSPGSVSYKFPFDGSKLDRYYYTGYQPRTLKQTSSLRTDPFLKIDRTGPLVHFDTHILSRILGFVHSETEALNLVAGSGFLKELTVQNTPPAWVEYVDATPDDRSQVRASFYLLPAPTRQRNTLNRVYVHDNKQERGPGWRQGGGLDGIEIETFVDMLDSYGFKVLDLIGGAYRTWNSVQPDSDLSFVAVNPEKLESLIRQVHSRNLQVILYLNLLPEEHETVWYQKHNAGRWKTEHPFVAMNSEPNDPSTRDVMCLNTPFYEHRLRDVDYLLDTLGADGVHIDWFSPFGCSQNHGSHVDIPTNNINKLIDLCLYIQQKGKKVYIHSGEWARIPYLENLADRVVSGESELDRVTPVSADQGIFDRWTSNRGNVNVMLDIRCAISEAAVRQEINWALLEGLNPFGFVYRKGWYAYGPTVRERIRTGIDPASIPIYDEYPFELLRPLRPFDLESMPVYPSKESPARTLDSQVAVTVLGGKEQQVLFIVNTNMTDEVSTTVLWDSSRLPLDPEKRYRITQLATGERLAVLSGKNLSSRGFRIVTPANSCVLVSVE